MVSQPRSDFPTVFTYEMEHELLYMLYTAPVVSSMHCCSAHAPASFGKLEVTGDAAAAMAPVGSGGVQFVHPPPAWLQAAGCPEVDLCPL